MEPPLESADPVWYLVLDLFGTWIGAFGSAAAAIAAVWLGLNAVRDQREQTLRQARAQAELVTLVRRWAHDGVHLQVRNDSARAITGVHVVTEGAQFEEARSTEARRDVIEPATSVEFFFHGVDDRQNLAAVEFDDAANQSWVRTSDGQLITVRRQHTEYVLVAYAPNPPYTVSSLAMRSHPRASPTPLLPRVPRQDRQARLRARMEKILRERARQAAAPDARAPLRRD